MRYPLVDPRPAGRRACGLIGVWLLARMASGAAALVSLCAPASGMTGAAMAAWEAASAVVFLPAAVAFLHWIYLTNRNAHGFGAAVQAHKRGAAMMTSPGWAVAWHLMPAAQWVMPLRDLDEVWRVTLSPTAPGEVAAPSILRWWWGSWLIASASGAVAALLPAAAPARPWSILLAATAALPLAVTAARVITRLSTLQHDAIRLQ